MRKYFGLDLDICNQKVYQTFTFPYRLLRHTPKRSCTKIFKIDLNSHLVISFTQNLLNPEIVNSHSKNSQNSKSNPNTQLQNQTPSNFQQSKLDEESFYFFIHFFELKNHSIV